MEIAAQIALNAVIAGAIYALVALGFNLIYGTARFLDIGYGALITVGGYAVFYFSTALGLPSILAIVLGILVAGALGYLFEKVIYRPLRARKASGTVLLVASLGVLTLVQAIIAIIFSSQFQTLARSGSERVYTILGGAITQTQVIIFAAALAIMLLLGLLLRYTLFGKAVRAVSDDEEVAKIVGINAEKIMGWVFFIGSAIAGAAGAAIAFDTGIQPTMGLSFLLKGAIAAIIGGIGNVYGGIIGAFFLAIIENLGAWQFAGEWKDAVAFAVLIVFLLFRPQGFWPSK